MMTDKHLKNCYMKLNKKKRKRLELGLKRMRLEEH